MKELIEAQGIIEKEERPFAWLETITQRQIDLLSEHRYLGDWTPVIPRQPLYARNFDIRDGVMTNKADISFDAFQGKERVVGVAMWDQPMGGNILFVCRISRPGAWNDGNFTDVDMDKNDRAVFSPGQFSFGIA